MKKNKESSFAHLLTAKDYLHTQWKNGQGESAEVAIYPAEAKLENENFIWRLSLATFTEKVGNFSDFTEYDRLLTLIEGSTLDLEFETHNKKSTLKLLEVLRFSGDSKARYTASTLPTKDLGFIFNREKVQAELNILKIETKPKSFQLTRKTYFFFMISGAVTASIYPGEIPFILSKGETLRIDPVVANPKEERFILLEPLLKAKEKKSALVVIEVDY